MLWMNDCMLRCALLARPAASLSRLLRVLTLTAAQTFVQRVRLTVACGDCNKPRCIFSAKRLTATQNQQLERLLDDLQFTCGSPLVPEGHELWGVVYSNEKLLCAADVCTAYYESFERLALKEVCMHCVRFDGESDRRDCASGLRALRFDGESDRRD
jgi:hypothetical protein